MKAILKNYRQSPRKVRLVADLIRGKSVKRAESELAFTPKRASLVLSKLINSAVANAKVKEGISKDSLYIKDIQVNEGRTLHRSMPMSRGRAFRIHKRSSHIDIKLGVKEVKEEKSSKVKIQDNKDKTKNIGAKKK